MGILVTGGAGYIGSHVCKYLKELGEEVIVVDNLETGYRDSVIADAFYELDIRDTDALIDVMKSHDIVGVIHFAAYSLVGVSMVKPYEYYDNNVVGTLSLLKAMQAAEVDNIVFSSTAATYGEPESVPIKESDKTEPTNPYGETKLAMEKMMKWFDTAYGMKYVALRYFNAAGASKDMSLGERHNPETHLIPLILQVPLGVRENISIFGTDYNTPDGTAIRDYIHVQDLASAHYLALKYLLDGNGSDVFNLGNGSGFSVQEVIDTARAVTSHPIPSVEAERRAGDPEVLIASSEKAQQVLGWEPKHSSLDEIIRDAWNYYNKN
ncbi:UDP-glucose 4-epimerase GalE [Microaceticoccus formicicus]|uniref:UDP-glucose 4-epimerase GalE n=1 Tax=Microaceticoccus formicicus TaxID=3118105 RepID=UPI003CD040E5|nr:UDP-glucose 4-epimerase GalE [Peptoniphilaceae bacterium AMB_02]